MAAAGRAVAGCEIDDVRCLWSFIVCSPGCCCLLVTPTHTLTHTRNCWLLQSLEAELDRSEQQAMHLQQQLLAREAEGAILRQQVTAAAQQVQQRAEELSQQSAQHEAELSSIRAELDGLNSELSQAASERSQAAWALAAEQAAGDQLRSQLAEALYSTDALTSEVAVLQQQLADATGQLSVLQQASGAAVQQETTLRQEVADLQVAVAQREQQAAQFKAEAAQAEAEKQQLLNKLAATAAAKESVTSQVGQRGCCVCLQVFVVVCAPAYRCSTWGHGNHTVCCLSVCAAVPAGVLQRTAGAGAPATA